MDLEITDFIKPEPEKNVVAQNVESAEALNHLALDAEILPAEEIKADTSFFGGLRGCIPKAATFFLVYTLVGLFNVYWLPIRKMPPLRAKIIALHPLRAPSHSHYRTNALQDLRIKNLCRWPRTLRMLRV